MTAKAILAPKRKNPILRRIKHFCERIEAYYRDQKKATAEIGEYVHELYLLGKSFQDKVMTKANARVSFKEKVGMVWHSYQSKRNKPSKFFKEKSGNNLQLESSLDPSTFVPLFASEIKEVNISEYEVENKY